MSGLAEKQRARLTEAAAAGLPPGESVRALALAQLRPGDRAVGVTGAALGPALGTFASLAAVKHLAFVVTERGFYLFPRKERESELHAEFLEEDSRQMA